MWGAARGFPDLTAFYAGRLFIVGAVSFIAVGIIVAGVLEFRRAKTTVDPVHPEEASVIVDTGIYGVTRNPMYLGILLLLAAGGAFLANAVPPAGPVLFVLYMNRFQIGPEERALTQVFGDPYRAYLARVSRWI